MVDRVFFFVPITLFLEPLGRPIDFPLGGRVISRMAKVLVDATTLNRG